MAEYHGRIGPHGVQMSPNNAPVRLQKQLAFGNYLASEQWRVWSRIRAGAC
jgi:hypothetical protein